MNESGRAVFLSYAREDADAARRIADALKAFGVEVWFDQHELRGGDQWDAKIRQQVRECALFVPIISATTGRVNGVRPFDVRHRTNAGAGRFARIANVERPDPLGNSHG